MEVRCPKPFLLFKTWRSESARHLNSNLVPLFSFQRTKPLDCAIRSTGWRAQPHRQSKPMGLATSRAQPFRPALAVILAASVIYRAPSALFANFAKKKQRAATADECRPRRRSACPFSVFATGKYSWLWSAAGSLNAGDRDDAQDVLCGASSRKVVHGPAQPLQDRADGVCASQAFDKFVTDIPCI